MHKKSLKRLQHPHDFALLNKKGERRTRYVLVLTLLTMGIEIVAGIVYGSMALLADGWHMATHVAAFTITLFAYRYARIHANDQTFAFGSGKVGVLGGFASAIALGVVAFVMLLESGERLLHPQTIHFDEAIAVASFGLLINFLCALLLRDSHDHHHDPAHPHAHDHHHDHNLKAAYFHVLADALTSVLAIIALAAGKYYGWQWLDPAMGSIGALIIMRWAHSLISETSGVLLDHSISLSDKIAITAAIENDDDNRVSDMHIWRVSPNHFAIIIAVVSDNPKKPDYYKALLKEFSTLSHITIEVNPCGEGNCHQQN